MNRIAGKRRTIFHRKLAADIDRTMVLNDGAILKGRSIRIGRDGSIIFNYSIRICFDILPVGFAIVHVIVSSPYGRVNEFSCVVCHLNDSHCSVIRKSTTVDESVIHCADCSLCIGCRTGVLDIFDIYTVIIL